MKKFKKFLAIAISVMMIAALAGCSSNGSGDGGKDAIKVAVFLYKFDDTYISTVRQSLQSIQEENKGNVTFEFFDGKGDQATQNDAIDTALQKDFDLLMGKHS